MLKMAQNEKISVKLKNDELTSTVTALEHQLERERATALLSSRREDPPHDEKTCAICQEEKHKQQLAHSKAIGLFSSTQDSYEEIKELAPTEIKFDPAGLKGDVTLGTGDQRIYLEGVPGSGSCTVD